MRSFKLREENYSTKGKIWRYFKDNEKKILDLQNKYSISKLLATILSKKNFDNDNYDDYLFPSIKKYLTDPYIILNIKEGVKLLYENIKKKKKE